VFNNLSWSDTLVLEVQYKECGEWGGHREQIRIYQSEVPPKGEVASWQQKPYTAAWLIDSVKCEYQSGHKFLLIQQQLINLSDEQLVERYLQQLFACGLQERETFRGPAAFRATLDDDFELSCYGHWRHEHDFVALREKLFRN
jgi:hypothetical protein